MTKSKNFLSFSFRLERYFALAAKSQDEQVDAKVVADTLKVTEANAKEFITRVENIRKGIVHSRPLKSQNSLQETDVVARDVFLTNVYLMRDLGLISLRVAKYLDMEIGSPINLDFSSLSRLRDEKFELSLGIGKKYTIEICQLMQACGIQKEIITELDKTLVTRAVQTVFVEANFSSDQIRSLLQNCAKKEITERAKKVLRKAGLSGPAIQLVLGNRSLGRIPTFPSMVLERLGLDGIGDSETPPTCD